PRYRFEAAEPPRVTPLDDHARDDRPHLPRAQRKALHARVRDREHGGPPARRGPPPPQVHGPFHGPEGGEGGGAGAVPEGVMTVRARLNGSRLSARKARLI